MTISVSRLRVIEYPIRLIRAGRLGFAKRQRKYAVSGVFLMISGAVFSSGKLGLVDPVLVGQKAYGGDASINEWLNDASDFNVRTCGSRSDQGGVRSGEKNPRYGEFHYATHAELASKREAAIEVKSARGGDDACNDV